MEWTGEGRKLATCNFWEKLQETSGVLPDRTRPPPQLSFHLRYKDCREAEGRNSRKLRRQWQ